MRLALARGSRPRPRATTVEHYCAATASGSSWHRRAPAPEHARHAELNNAAAAALAPLGAEGSIGVREGGGCRCEMDLRRRLLRSLLLSRLRRCTIAKNVARTGAQAGRGATTTVGAALQAVLAAVLDGASPPECTPPL